MDPLTQGVLGANYSHSFTQDKSHHKRAIIIGFLSGMSADLDVLIRSSSDTLLFLEYHRQFTHSLIFIPIGAFICSLVFYFIFKKEIPFKFVYLYSFLGYATHALLDSCTSYGTQLFWPFSNQRVAWNNISIIDPLYTIPLLILMILGLRKKKKVYSQVAIVYGLLYLSFGFIQKSRIHNLAVELATSRNHHPQSIQVKPSFGNLILWKSFYEFDGIYYVDAIRATFQTQYYQGKTIKKLDLDRDLPRLDNTSQLALDIKRFSWFSKGFLALDPSNPNHIIDVRYSIIPNDIKPLWGIVFDINKQEEHAEFITSKKVEKKARVRLLEMMLGKN